MRKNGHTCVVGLLWGDEGKGKVVDVLVERHDVVVRYSGGANAGHTVVFGGEKFALHQLPSGVLRETVRNIIAPGAVIDPAVLLGEISSLRARGIDVTGRLHVSDRAHLVFPYHRKQDQLAERAAHPGEKLGTTTRGIGPCYADKVLRTHGVRVGDLFRPERLRERLAAIVAHKNAYFRALYDQRESFDAGAIADEYLAFGDELRAYVTDTTLLLHDLMKSGQRVLFEGAQGSLLDIDHGTYPFVTSSNCGGGGVASGAGVPLSTPSALVGVIKAYATRVGAGPFPTELTDVVGDTIRERGGEYGTTTGRPRRCGWFDLVAASYAALIAGPTRLAIMHLDTLSGFDELQVCTAYRLGDRLLTSLPPDAATLDEVEPVYESFPGWPEDLAACRRLEDLPPTARQYVQMLAQRLGCPLGMVSVGPAREQTILIDGGC